MTRNEAAPAPRPQPGTEASSEFQHLREAQVYMVGSLPADQRRVVRENRLFSMDPVQHTHLVNAIADTEGGLETVTAAVIWGWREVAAGRKKLVLHQSTFSKNGGAWTHLLADYRASIAKAAAAEERKANPPEPVELERTPEQMADNAAIIAAIVPEFMQ